MVDSVREIKTFDVSSVLSPCESPLTYSLASNINYCYGEETLLSWRNTSIWPEMVGFRCDVISIVKVVILSVLSWLDTWAKLMRCLICNLLLRTCLIFWITCSIWNTKRENNGSVTVTHITTRVSVYITPQGHNTRHIKVSPTRVCNKIMLP